MMESMFALVVVSGAVLAIMMIVYTAWRLGRIYGFHVAQVRVMNIIRHIGDHYMEGPRTEEVMIRMQTLLAIMDALDPSLKTNRDDDEEEEDDNELQNGHDATRPGMEEHPGHAPPTTPTTRTDGRR